MGYNCVAYYRFPETWYSQGNVGQSVIESVIEGKGHLKRYNAITITFFVIWISNLLLQTSFKNYNKQTDIDIGLLGFRAYMPTPSVSKKCRQEPIGA